MPIPLELPIETDIPLSVLEADITNYLEIRTLPVALRDMGVTKMWHLLAYPVRDLYDLTGLPKWALRNIRDQVEAKGHRFDAFPRRAKFAFARTLPFQVDGKTKEVRIHDLVSSPSWYIADSTTVAILHDYGLWVGMPISKLFRYTPKQFARSKPRTSRVVTGSV